MLNNINYNPDVLTCLANLSNDEVFTPPELVNDILDTLPIELFENKETTFLDPVCKSGVFLREIAKRLMNGLENEIPDKQKRINHIFKNQLFGIAITEITSLLSRRSVYCSKTANGKYSVCETFDDKQGNIIFKRTNHKWKNGKCEFCGASKKTYNRDKTFETHAYQFIHTEKPEEIFKMKFDVIVGNPPYQMSDGGFGKSAKPIYHKFVEQAKKLNPRFLTMIIPSRWFAGGKGLDQFRAEMLNDSRIKKLIDYWDSTDCFPGVDIAGGICYFLWKNDYKGTCEITNIHKDSRTISTRSLNEFNTLIRFGQAANIVKKIRLLNEINMSNIVSSRKPFGLATNVRPSKKGELTLVWNGGKGPFDFKNVLVGKELIKKWKVITSKVSYDHGGQPDKDGKRRVLSKIDILPPNTICTETYIIVSSFDNEIKSKNLVSYLKSKFVRFLISQLSFSQDITKDRFAFVPMQDFSKSWTDEELYKKYGLDEKEIEFIESMIRPME
ncbi:MAG: Eco57I restriction-modification methylase domain-containing protein [Candidatus Cloacimonadota bacterium]|nr:Eco57I restriction-modification methylase domain-containing protein [Candidatus Cloacimonadota bacterium]